MYLGIHFRDASFHGITIGRQVGEKVFKLYSQYLTGEKDNDKNVSDQKEDQDIKTKIKSYTLALECYLKILRILEKVDK